MRSTLLATAWAVYRTVQGEQVSSASVCEQQEWEALSRSEPSRYVLVSGNINSEAEAERLARNDNASRPAPTKKVKRTVVG